MFAFGCGCFALVMTLVMASYMQWYVNNALEFSKLSDISFLTSIESDWKMKPFVGLQMIVPKKGEEDS